jgi:hypothetical protein
MGLWNAVGSPTAITNDLPSVSETIRAVGVHSREEGQQTRIDVGHADALACRHQIY